MSDYYNIAYRRRLNRFGLDYQSRIQAQRERNFESYLYKTIYRVDFRYNGDCYPASLEPYKQDYTETQSYLLTKTDVKLPNGAILKVERQDETVSYWMVWWLENVEGGGYNRYVILKVSHELEWNHQGVCYKQQGHFSGPGTSTVSDTVKSATGRPVYGENNNLHMFVTPYNEFLVKDAYFEVVQEKTRQGYVIKEFDINSTPGVAYVSVDPVPLREKVTPPSQTVADPQEAFYWLNGGRV